MKIVIINGSARRGNTLTAIDAFIKGASEKNEIEIIQPDRLHIAPCKGCGVCQCYKGCIATVYKGNIIKNLIMDCQSYTKYRPNETTGGIFVSWRRKEELPTGA